MKFLTLLSFLSLAFFSINGAPASKPSGDERLRLKIIQHQPCSRQGFSGERIRFPNLDQAPLLQDKRRGDGCYVISGPVHVKKAISGTVQIYSEVRFGTKAPAEECRSADSNNCGGVGSCVYCDACSTANSVDKSSKGLVQIESSDSQTKLDCQKGLAAGNYTTIRISFCLPTKNDIVKSGAIDDQLMNDANGQVFFMNLVLFADKANTWSASELRKAANTDSGKVIGCHKIAGQIYTADA